MSRARGRALAPAPAAAGLLALLFGLADAAAQDPDPAPVPEGPDVVSLGGVDAGGWLGPYSMTREASGTSWQPDAAGMEGLHFAAGSWRMMAHGSVDLVQTWQGGPRGGNQLFTTNMAMLAADRRWGSNR